jgi:hypothetical protein
MAPIPSSLVRRSNQPITAILNRLLNQDCQVTDKSLLNLGIQTEISGLPSRNSARSKRYAPANAGTPCWEGGGGPTGP